MSRLFFLATSILACTLSAGAQNLNIEPLQLKGFSADLTQASEMGLVRISPTPKGVPQSESRAPNAWSIQGYELRTIIGLVYNYDASRVVFSDPKLAGRRYDVSLVLPKCEQDEVLHARVREALLHQLGIAVAPRSVEKDVYVLTAPHAPEVRLVRASGTRTTLTTTTTDADDSDGETTAKGHLENAVSRRAADDMSLDAISMSAGTVNDLCALLEHGLDRPVLNETGLTGKFDVELQKGSLTREEFFTHLRSQLGLHIAREKRQVAILTVRPE